MHWINTVLELLSFGWVGSIIGLLGLIAAVVTYLLTRQRTRLAYRCDGERLLGLAADGLPAGITVYYCGQGIHKLTQTFVVLWNAGEKTILGDDIVAADQLRLKLRGDGRVLAATVLKTKRDVCKIEALIDVSCTNETHIHFDFLDAGDGAAIEILHTSEEIYVDFLGTVRGIPHGLHNLGAIWRLSSQQIIFAAVMAITGSCIAEYTFGIPVIIFGKNFIRFLIGFAMGMIVSIIIFIYSNRKRYPKYLHIEELS